MKLLAIDTSMAACSVAVADSDHDLPLAKAQVAMERGHAEALAPMVRMAMEEAGLAFSDLDRIAVTIGPGTFTGVRIGLAMARGLGLALDIPVAGIDTLSAISVNEAERDQPILVAADARRDEVYAALFSGGRIMDKPAVMTAARAAQLLPEGPCTILGSGAHRVVAAAGRDDLTRSRAGDLPSAANFWPLAIAAPVSGSMPAPLYLRAPDAKPQQIDAAIVIREASLAEAPVLAALHAESFDNPWSAGEFAKLMAMPGATAALALAGDEPIGFALLRRAADEAEIVSIATRPSAQRRGIAGKLIAHQAARLAALGARALFIEVAHSNAAARALYAACGFSEAGRRPDYYESRAGREDAIVMRKALVP
ncbi:MAG: tRNA (adenosine(37)-N6)-threonylcarbamoyltransferase complex dimerization subunit type 1 TsaB [Hyphomicrobiales bacterium]